MAPRRLAAVCVACTLALGAPRALAQSERSGGGGGGSGGARAAVKGGDGGVDPGRLVIDEDLTAKQAGAEARARAKAGDCRSALDAFDAALRTSIDPTLYRDRGLCHEKLGHAFPARDDFRRYLTERPEAFDAEDIRKRLARAEGAPEDEVPDDTGDAKGARGAGVEASTSRDVDVIEAAEVRRAEADASPLRRGSGFALGPYFAARRWGKDDYGWGQAFGAALRWVPGKIGSVIGEIGYAQVSSSGTDASLGGLSLFAGYEVRLGLDDAVTNALIAGGGLGYERLRQAATGSVASIVVPRGRFGYRHVFGPTLGLEGTVDGGPAFIHVLDSTVDATTFFVGGAVALLVGF